MKTMGLTHVYYGMGKGKTSAAFGLALRASGAGKSVVVVQFLKSRPSSEVGQCEKLPGITILRGTAGDEFAFEMTPEQKERTRRLHDRNFADAMAMVITGDCDVLILDEALDALSLGLLDEDMFYGLLESKPEALELVITGHEPIARVLELADYVTEMRAVKHPYNEGVPARRGIEF